MLGKDHVCSPESGLWMLQARRMVWTCVRMRSGMEKGAGATDVISNKEADWTVIGISRSGKIALVQIFIYFAA